MKDRSIFGSILVLLGLGFLLDQFNVISFNDIINIYWPIILIVIGGVGLLNSRSSKTINALLVVFGLLFQARNLDLIDINIFRVFWPIVLIIVGIRIIFGKDSAIINTNYNSKSSNKNVSFEDYINESAIMAGIETNIESQEFKGGKITAIMGGVELDLRGAKLNNNEATININVIMGGVEIYVPEDWKIEHRGTPILGGFSSKRRYKQDQDSPVLRIEFSAIMGGVEIV